MDSKNTRLDALRPTSSSLSTRYERKKCLVPYHQNIRPGHLSYGGEPQPPYLPPGCSAHLNPEGQVYFAWDHKLKVVTEDNVYSADVQAKMEAWIDMIAAVLKEREIHLSDSVELYLELEDPDACLYYFVDHSTRSAFWLDEHSTEDLWMLPVVSDSHLQLALRGLYWAHIEIFPSHRFDQLTLDCDELIGIFFHGRADRLTSNTSTFPRSATGSLECIELLRTTQSMSMSSYTVWTTARLWGIIMNHRFNTYYGQQNVRLNIDQSVIDVPTYQEGRAFRLTNWLLYGVPAEYLRRFDALFVDKLVYVEPWQNFITASVDEWKSIIVATFALLIVNALLLLSPTFSSLLATICICLCNISLGSAILLMWRHQRSMPEDANAAAEFLGTSQHESYGFQRIATLYSLPKAAFIYALGVSLTQGFVGIANTSSIYYSAGVALCIIIFALWTWAAPLSSGLGSLKRKTSQLMGSLLCCVRRRPDEGAISCEV